MKTYTKAAVKRGRPKGRSQDHRSFGPLGDLIRKNRLEKGLGLADIAKACDCSVQFVSNIEHGRAPLPWEKVEVLSNILKVTVAELQAANMAVRSDFKSFVGTTRRRAGSPGSIAALTAAVKDPVLQEIIQKYHTAGVESRKKFARAANELLIRQ